MRVVALVSLILMIMLGGMIWQSNHHQSHPGSSVMNDQFQSQLTSTHFLNQHHHFMNAIKSMSRRMQKTNAEEYIGTIQFENKQIVITQENGMNYHVYFKKEQNVFSTALLQQFEAHLPDGVESAYSKDKWETPTVFFSGSTREPSYDQINQKWSTSVEHGTLWTVAPHTDKDAAYDMIYPVLYSNIDKVGHGPRFPTHPQIGYISVYQLDEPRITPQNYVISEFHSNEIPAQLGMEYCQTETVLGRTGYIDNSGMWDGGAPNHEGFDPDTMPDAWIFFQPMQKYLDLKRVYTIHWNGVQPDIGLGRLFLIDFFLIAIVYGFYKFMFGGPGVQISQATTGTHYGAMV